MTVALILACGAIGLVLAACIPTDYPPQSPIGEAMPKRWAPHPRTVVQVVEVEGEAT